MRFAGRTLAFAVALGLTAAAAAHHDWAWTQEDSPSGWRRYARARQVLR